MVLSLDEVKLKLKETLNKSRYEHVLRVGDTALRLNKDLNLGLNDEKVVYAAILHDCAKHNEEKYYEMFKSKYNLKEDVFEYFPIAHAILGEIVAKEIYGINDAEILSSIRWHTTGKENMTKLEKLVFIADFVEPGRTFKDAKIVRDELYVNFDRGILLCLDLTIKHLIDNHVIINVETIKARNYLQRRVNE